MTYAIIDAQGCYGSHATVYATYETLEKADSARRARTTVAKVDADVGDKIHRLDAARYEARADADRDEVHSKLKAAQAELVKAKRSWSACGRCTEHVS